MRVRVKERSSAGRKGYTQNASRSIIVITVSRCMKARSRGSSTTMTVSVAPAWNRRPGEDLDALRVERSPMPIMTARLPITVMSPPSMVAVSWASESLP